MKKGYTKFYIFAILFFIIIALYFGYTSAKISYTDAQLKNTSNNSNYNWITDGTCSSHGMKDLTNNDCSGYFQSSNYTITGAEHGPPGCWLVLGKSLDGVLKSNPQFAGKGFGCWSQNTSDGKQCSPDFPCVCK
jgi:hypothetical protein